MSILLLIGFLWGLSALVRALRDADREAKRQRELERLRAEQAKRAAETERLRREWRQRQEEAKAETARMIAMQREQDRQRREQERLAREQERQAKEQARQAAQLARHEEQLAKLEQQIDLAEREIAHYGPIVDQLRQESEALTFKVEHYENRGLPCGGYKTQLERVNEKLFRMETKLIKAENTKQIAQHKLSA